jgi:hypothetical protein
MNLCRRIFGGLAIVLFLAMSVSVAEAEQRRQRSSAREGNRQSDFQPGRPDEGRRSSYQRNDERAMQRQQHRLSPEERSRLRRDIREAGKEIYPARR